MLRGVMKEKTFGQKKEILCRYMFGTFLGNEINNLTCKDISTGSNVRKAYYLCA